jgi:hypothetical protein
MEAGPMAIIQQQPGLVSLVTDSSYPGPHRFAGEVIDTRWHLSLFRYC